MDHSTSSAKGDTPDRDSLRSATLPSAKTLGFVASGLTFGLFVTLGVATQLINPAFGIWFTEVFIFLGVAWVLVQLSGRDPIRYAGIAFCGWSPILFGLALGAVNFFAIVVPIQLAAQSIAPPWMRDQFDASHLFKNQSHFELAAIIAGVGVAAPFCEEFMFRGVLQQGLMSGARGSRKAIVTAAVIFSAFHLDPIGFLARAELGLVFGILFWRTGSLWPGVMAHAANNLVSTGIFFVAKDLGAPQEAPPDWQSIVLFVGLGNLLLAGLISAARRQPSLLPINRRAELATGPPLRRALTSLVLPWVIGALGSLLVLGLLDSRGLALRAYDAAYRLPRSSASESENSERDALDALREQVHRGKVPLDDYARRRRDLSRRLRKGHPERSVPLQKPVAPHG